MKRQLSVAVMIALLASLPGCQAPPEETEPLIRPVRYTRVVVGGARERRVFSGVTRAALEADLSFKVPGNVTDISVSVGDSVEKGQVVARLDPTDYEVTLRQAEAGLERARAQLRNAHSNFERTRELYENRNVSRSELDNARANSESAEAQVRADQQRLEAARLQLSYTRLVAPEKCTLAEQYVEENQNVAAGQGIVQVNCGECAEVVVDVPAAYIGRVQPDSEARVSVTALGKQYFRGVVAEIGVAAGSRSTYPVTVQVRDDCSDMRSGMAADVELVVPGTGIQGITVPFIAVGEDSEGNFVYVLIPDDDETWRAEKRRVTVAGAPAAAGIRLTSGLEEGELIATAGIRRLTEGQRLTLLAE